MKNMMTLSIKAPSIHPSCPQTVPHHSILRRQTTPKRGPSAFILASLIETELNLPLREDLTGFL